MMPRKNWFHIVSRKKIIDDKTFPKTINEKPYAIHAIRAYICGLENSLYYEWKLAYRC
jgi:hypothetical protein